MWKARAAEYQAILDKSALRVGHLKLVLDPSRSPGNVPGGRDTLLKCGGIVYPLMDDGTPMCFAWVMKGDCFELCCRHDAHKEWSSMSAGTQRR